MAAAATEPFRKSLRFDDMVILLWHAKLHDPCGGNGTGHDVQKLTAASPRQPQAAAIAWISGNGFDESQRGGMARSRVNPITAPTRSVPASR